MATEKKNKDYILYNLLVHTEWPLEGEVLNKDSHLSILQKRGSFRQKLLTLIKGSAFGLWLTLKYPFRGFTVSHGLPKELSQLYESSECWHFLLSSDGKYVAILQDIYIEIRSVRNNFATVTSKCQVHKDEYPKWRRMAWSSDSSLLAFAHSWGEVVVFDLSGTSLFSIKDSSLSGVYHGPSMFLHNKSISGLLFLDEDKMNPGLTELLVISYKGQINSYIINNRSGEHTKKCSFSFQSVLSQGVSCALYYPSARLLILGSPSPCITGTSALGNCVTLWRLLSDKPYFKLVEDQALELSKRRQESGIISKLLPGRSTNKQHGVWKMSLSPDGKMLLVLHIAGRLSLWKMPSMTLLESWERDELPEYKCEDLHMAARQSKVQQKELIYDIGWWSDNAMILARRSGALTVSTADRSLRNILGQYAEWCEPLPLVTSISDGGFLILECENNVVTLSPARKSVTNVGEQGTHEDDEEEDEHHIVTKARELTNHILYFLTESERFRSQIRRPKIAKKVYRLLCLRSTTPEELYARKIELEEYGKALALAQSYNLDCDLVYQKQWRKSPVTVSSIHDYLSKVTKRIWVLHECLERVAEDIDSTKALLKYGLYNTGLHVLASMGNMDNPFLKEKDDDDEVEASDDRENEQKLLKTINFNNLSVEQRNLCRYRLRFLKYLDRLSTYEAILGGPAFAHDSFDSTFFTNFRDSNIVDVAVDFARDNDWNAVDFLLTYHGEDALPHYLSIISNFPETTNPYVYRTLLPEAGIDENEPEIYKWEQKTWRTQDWVENSKFSKICQTYVDVDLGNNLYEENVKLKIFSGALDAVKLTEWFKYRANEIERLSGQIDNALQLVKLGKEKGVKGLNTLLIDLSTMSTLIYECQDESSIDLETFEKLSNLEKMDLLLAKSSDATFVDDFKRWVIPFLDNVEKQTRGGKMKLIQQYMTETAKSNIAYPLKILQQSVRESKEPFIPDVARQMKLAMDCIYLCQREDQLDKAEEILRLFPSSCEGIMSQQIMALRTKLNETATYLRGTRILCDNDVPKPVSFLVNSRADEEAARSVMTNLSRKAQHREPPLKPSQWDKLLSDMLKLRHEIFTCIVPSVCYEAFLDCLITSGSLENINHAKRLLSCKPDVDSISKKIDQTKLIELVVKASREYFNSANNARDSCIHLAKACLALVPNSEHSVKEETDLICALSMLTDYKVSILPLQVRLCQDKLNLIENVLDSSPHSYKDAGKLLNLASLLRLSGSDENTRRGRVLRLVAQRAMDHDDFDVSYNACAELIKSAYVPGWKICRALGEKIEFANLKARQKLLNFALAHCEPGVMETVLHARSLLRTQIVYGELGGLLENVGDTSQLDTDLTTTEQISKTTRSILSSVSDVGWWADTLQWVRPLQRKTTNQSREKSAKKLEPKDLEFHCHPFYETVHRSAFHGKDDNLKDRSAVTTQKVNELLLQTQKMAEERAEGSLEERATEILIQLADVHFSSDTPLAMAYLMALPESTNAYECFEKLPSSALSLQLASYYYALQVYILCTPQTEDTLASVYLHPPVAVLEHVVENDRVFEETGSDVKSLLSHLRRYQSRFTDFSQARLLQGLGRGVDIGRFTQDEEYKKETILGLTMSIDDNIFNTAISLAEQYGISKWEMLMSHLEWLFTDSDLSTKQLQDRVDGKEIMPTLLKEPEKMISRFKEYVYPSIDGKQLARLLYYYMLMNECVQAAGITCEGDSDPQMHMRLIKKIKSSSQGVNYKSLMEDGDPLLTMKPHLLSENVHVFAKMANKLRDKNGGILTSSHVFKVFAEKIFWQGERRNIEKEVDWIHRYEEVHGYLERLSFKHLLELVDSLTFSERAVDTLTVDVRDEVLRRAIKFCRRRGTPGKQKKSKENIDIDGTFSVSEVGQHFEQSLKHLSSLANETILKLTDSDEMRYVQYARLYDLSRSEPDKIKELGIRVLCNGDPLELAGELLELAGEQNAQRSKMRDVINGALRTILNTFSRDEGQLYNVSRDVSSKELLRKILTTLKEHLNDENIVRKFVKEEDILHEIRNFCADEVVAPEVKHEVLQLIENYVTLRGEDKTLLLFHQTQTIVCQHWDIELSVVNVETCNSLRCTFQQLFEKSSTLEQLIALTSLLSIWPPLDLEEAWYLVLLKLINQTKDGDSVVKIIREKSDRIYVKKTNYKDILNAALENCLKLDAFKIGLMFEDSESCERIVEEMKRIDRSDAKWDDELLELIFKNRLSPKIVETPYFDAFVNYLLNGELNSRSSREFRVNEVIRGLHRAGYTVDAASIKSSYDNLHPSLRTLENVVGLFMKWIGNS